ncbi:unnamed protein product [Calicophoron daubneyi]|uniref:Phospholipid/glycerol acyltransferase domain-containing protein n=1 Tax=Calicophoron daubneyi TaxID=300641 RepID=A0AAV2T2R3_CALDB
MFRILYFCLLGCLLLITSVTAHRLKTVLKMLDEIYHGQANWTTLIPAEWIDRALDIPGSGYVIAFVYWLRRPILLCFLLPLTILIFVYVSVLFIYLCRLRWWLARQLTEWWPLRPRRRTRYHSFSSVPRANLASLAQLAKRLIAALWDAHGRIVHAYEIVGMEKLPMTGPALVIYYHGTCPFDAYYFLARHCIERDRFPVAVVDRFLFRMPLMRSTLELMGAVEGSIGELVSHLSPGSRSGRTSHESDKEVSEGDVVLLAPGGVREALFADESYSILWGRRTGFARVAILASQPIFPMFTENIRETIRIVQFGKSGLCP